MINGKLPVREKICYGFGDCAYSLTYVFLQIFILAYMTNVAKLPTMAAGTLVLVANIFDAVNDPMIGYIADRKHTKIGRYRPWILFACVPSALFLVLCFMTPDISVTGRVIYSYAVFLIWTVLKTCVQVPYAALSAAMTPDANERAQLGAIREWGANIGALVGVAYCFTLSVVWGALPDASDYGYHKTGVSVPGMLFAFATLAMGCGSGVAGFLASVVLNFFHYDNTAMVQTESVCNGIYLGFGGVTIIFGILMMVCGFLYTLSEDKMVKIRADLEERMARK